MEANGGLTIPAKGVGGSWILKLPSVRFPAVPEIEYAMMELARAVGIEVPTVRLVSPDNLANIPEEVVPLGNVLAVRRFDRADGNRRIHIEDFAQVFGVFPGRKYEMASYEDIARVLWAEAGLESVVELARRLAFSALIGNADMHLKNWSVLYENGVSAELAPAYDLVATVAYINDTRLALSLAKTKDMHAVSADLFARFAGRAGIPEVPVVEAARETAERLRSEWGRHAAVRDIPDELRSKVTEHMRLVPLGR